MLSLILPCYNPSPNWAENVIRHYAALQARINTSSELIVVNDGSTLDIPDRDIQLLRENIGSFRYISYVQNKGKGYAIRRGMMEAQGDILIFTDIDFPYTDESLVDIYEALSSHTADVAFGVKDASYYKEVPALRKVISRGLQWMVRAFLSLPVTDTQCGLKGFNRKVLPLFLKTETDRYLFDLEFLRNCYRSKEGYRMKPIPVRLNEGVNFRNMNYKILIPETMNFIRLSLKRTR